MSEANEQQRTGSGSPDGSTDVAAATKPEIGKRYGLQHCRFGVAVVDVVEIVDDEWTDVEVLSGHLSGIGAGANWGPGDVKRVRNEHCEWTYEGIRAVPVKASRDEKPSQ